MELDVWKVFPGDNRLDRVVSISLWVYVGSLLLWLVARTVIGDVSLFVASFGYLGVWMFTPLLVFGPWIYHKRSKPGAILLIIPCLLCVWFYGIHFVPEGSRVSEINEPLSILTFNILNTNSDDAALVEVIESRPADILTLQEVSLGQNRQLSAALADQYPYRWFYRPDGMAIYSVHPITSKEIYPAQPWAIQSAVLEVDETPVHIINAHLAKPGIMLSLERRSLGVIGELAAERLDQIALIKEIIGDRDLPAVVSCDCNMTNLTSAYTRMTSDLQDAFLKRGWGFGHTFLLPRGFDIQSGFNLPVQRIDYIFHTAGIEAAEVELVNGDSGSDHLPLWVLVDVDP